MSASSSRRCAGYSSPAATAATRSTPRDPARTGWSQPSAKDRWRSTSSSDAIAQCSINAMRRSPRSRTAPASTAGRYASTSSPGPDPDPVPSQPLPTPRPSADGLIPPMSERASFGALARRLAATALPHDPNRTSLRKGIRAALVVTVLFAVTLEVVGGQQLATFAAFSSFVLLGMTDFGGPMRSRALAYLAGTFVCAGLVALGTVLSVSVWSSVAGMLVVAFVVEFIGILGGYYAIAAPALILAYVLPTTIQALASDVPVRVAGWLVGGLTATVAALLLLPRRDRAGLRDALAATCERAAELVVAEIAAGDPATIARLRQAAVEALSTARARFAATLYKPTGPTAPDQALSQIVEELSGLLAFVSGAKERLSAVPTADRALATAMVDALRSAAIGLRGTADAVALERLREARQSQWQGLETVARVQSAGRRDDPAAPLHKPFRTPR